MNLQNVHVTSGTKLWTTYCMSASNFRRREREKLISNEFKHGNGPVNKTYLVNEYRKYFNQFKNTLDFEKL